MRGGEEVTDEGIVFLGCVELAGVEVVTVVDVESAMDVLCRWARLGGGRVCLFAVLF